MLEFSFFKGPITNKSPRHAVTLDRAIELVRSDLYRNEIRRLRRMSNRHKQNNLKFKLDYFVFSGLFTERYSDSLLKHSGLICLDFDDVWDGGMKMYRNNLTYVEFVAAAFLSPTGRGLKVICRIDPLRHTESFEGLLQYFYEYFELDADRGGKDVTRACFVSWDPDAYYNPNARVYVPPSPIYLKQESDSDLDSGEESESFGLEYLNSITKHL